jgi:hypothetical protein
MRARQRRKAKRGFLAFLAILAYGGFMAEVDVVGAKHPTLLTWFWAALIGVVVYVVVAGLLTDPE